MSQDQIARYIELVRKLSGIMSMKELEEYQELDTMYREMQRRRLCKGEDHGVES